MRIKNNENGFVGADIVVGLAILMMFIALITTIYVNTNHNAMSIQRTARATEIITNVFEKMDSVYYDEIPLCKDVTLKTEDNVLKATLPNNDNINDLESILAGINIPRGYEVNLQVIKYNPESDSETQIDLVKKITITIKYNVSKKQEEILMNKIKSRENIIVPNPPILEDKTYAIKYNQADKKWYKTESNDKAWYNYDNLIALTDNNGNKILSGVAYSVKSDNVTLGFNNEVIFNSNAIIKAWIPCYGKVDGDYKYLYLKTGKSTKRINAQGAFVNALNNDEKITVPDIFLENPEDSSSIKEGIWKEITNEVYTNYCKILGFE